ncbi:MAG: hypothetical protein L6290_04815, partial [Thermodesulfovibrionales bacterium]|nr:hypothetical protein [Thermodesulfovibrionales bacterium]
SLMPLAAAIFWGGTGLRILTLILIVFAGIFLHLSPEFLKIRMSPYKGLPAVLQYPGAEHLRTYVSTFARIDTFRSPAVRYAPGLSLRYLDPLPDQIGFSIDGGETNAVTSGVNRESFDFLRYLPSALPYELKSNAEISSQPRNVLIIDPKGGLQALVAEYYHSGVVQKIESNPLLLEIIKKDFHAFSGGIYAENTSEGLGRLWLRNSKKHFDIIDISLTGSYPAGSFGILEDYRFTTDAFREYIRHLQKDGVLSIHLFILPPPRTELRVLLTGISALEEMGIQDITQHIAAVRSIETLCILFKKSPLNPGDIRKIRQFSESRRFDTVFYPGIPDTESNRFIRMPTNEYSEAFQMLLQKERRAEFIRSYLFDIAPVDDENPFFHSYLKLRNIREIYTVMGKKWQFFVEEGYILPVVFVQILAASILFILFPVFLRGKPKEHREGAEKKKIALFLSYFAFLGIGFMFIEIPLIQKMILPLEHPSYAFAALLISILVSSGAGSLASQRIEKIRSPFVLILISLIVIIWSFLIPLISGYMSSLAFPARVVMTFLFFFPIGFPMGIPFPLGLLVLGERLKALIPWAWAVNGCCSVLAPVLAVMLAMITGYTVVLWLGALCYLIAFLLLISSSRPPRPSARMRPATVVQHQDRPSS